jgi:hypothetical protein
MTSIFSRGQLQNLGVLREILVHVRGASSFTDGSVLVLGQSIAFRSRTPRKAAVGVFFYDRLSFGRGPDGKELPGSRIL